MTVVENTDTADTAQVRSFGRTVTQRVGALQDNFLGRDRPLAESRLLYEVGAAGADVRQLRDRLGLDSGYVSRLLRSLERQGLLEVTSHPDDGRVRRVRLTAAGAAEVDELNRLSDRRAEELLTPLRPDQRRRLVTAMAEVERLLRAAAVTFAPEDLAGPAARSCLERFGAELAVRFRQGYDPGTTIPVDPAEVTPPNGVFVVARADGEPVGCGALRRATDAPDAGEIKRMWVDRSVRGLGVGGRLLDELERHARAFGLARVRLETNEALTEAIALYRRHGYVEVPPFNDELYGDHWFEKHL